MVVGRCLHTLSHLLWFVFFLLLWISYQMSRAQLCHCRLIVPCCLASTACRSAVESWNCWRKALLSWLWLWEGAFTHYHIFCGLSSFCCCEFHTEQADPRFVIIGWLSHAVRHRRPVGVQLIVGIAGGRHCFHNYSCEKAPSHTITSFVVCLCFTAVNFILNKQSPALSSSVDCTMLFGIDGL